MKELRKKNKTETDPHIQLTAQISNKQKSFTDKKTGDQHVHFAQ